MVVVANKCDLDYERQVGTHGACHGFERLENANRIVLRTEGKDLAKHFGCRFIETSAKQRINVDEAFGNLVREIRKYNKVKNCPQGHSGLADPFLLQEQTAGRTQTQQGMQMSMQDKQADKAGCCNGCVIV